MPPSPKLVEGKDEYTNIGNVIELGVMKPANKIRQAIEGVVGKDIDFVVEHPADESKGDWAANIALVMFQELKTIKNPRELAEKIVVELKKSEVLGEVVDLSRVEVAGPGFINFWVKESWLLSEASKVSQLGDEYGKGGWGKGKIYEVEHTSPNPNKAMHIGHLRNNVTGMALANIFEAGGIKVIRDEIDNNRGIAIAKLMWGYLKFAKKDKKEITDMKYWNDHQDEWETPEDKGIRPDLFVDELYVKGSEDYKVSEEIENSIKKLVVDWENEDKSTWALWKKVLDYSYQGQNLTLARLRNKWDKIWREHEHYKAGKAMVTAGLKKGVFKKLPDGAIITQLEKYGIPDTVVVKKDGTSLYITQDLALTKLKKETFHANRIFWVIGPEQSLAMRQVFCVSEQLGIGKVSEFTHIPYGYITIKGRGKMSSRTGNVVYIDQLLDLAKEEIVEKIKDRGFSKKETEVISEKLGIGSVKYSILKVGRLTDMDYDLETSISFEGDSGPYLNYVYVRVKGVMKKVGNEKSDVVADELSETEKSVLRWIARFPEAVESAGKDLAPNLICSYLFELSQKYNSFYGKNQIADGGKFMGRRLAINNAVGQIIKNGLKLLGIEVVEKM